MEKAKKTRIILKNTEVPQWYLDLEPKLLQAIEEVNKAEEHLESIRSIVYNMMKENDINEIITDATDATRITSSFTTKFNMKKFKKELPAVYAEYIKVTSRKGSLKIKLK